MSTSGVSLVIPGRNCAQTIRHCLSAAVPLREQTRLSEIIFVDDGSTDDTRIIVADFPVRCVAGATQGPGAARNLGWRAARYPLVWFVDADCVPEPDALSLLLPHLVDPRVGGVSGSYGIMNPESRLACLIHEEIIERHRTMPARVDFLATFNVIYRRTILEQIGGFDERFLKAQDAELSFRVMEAGYELRFEFNSRVKHFHPSSWRRYLSTQRAQGYWRVWLHLAHRGHAAGDSYSRLVDHVQPPLAVLLGVLSPFFFVPNVRWMPASVFLLLVAAQIPMTFRLTARLRKPPYLAFAPMGFIRAFWRGIGMVHGVLSCLPVRFRKRGSNTEN